MTNKTKTGMTERTNSASTGAQTTKPTPLHSDDSATYLARPRTKPDVTTKGKMNEWANGYREFIPVGSRPSNRTMLKQLGNSSFYKSEGAKESSYSLHLNVDGHSEDPVGEMFEQFVILTEGERKQKPTMPEGAEGRMLLDDGQTQIWLDTAKGEVTVQTRLQCSTQIERQMLQAEAVMSVALARWRKEILNVSNNK